ncbi:hypothetical protein ABMA27_005287 [Loxostege sticticalis]|uniref:DDE Tnp4 domain-containing protein n=1 Tax=Loxostege sticticalis TaxID=481309 RepID=A0ABR3HIL6_LOXSC
MARAVLAAAAEEERLKRQLCLHRRHLRLNSMPTDLPEREFVALFRLRYVLSSLMIYAHGSYQRLSGTNYDLGLSQTTVSDCLSEVTEAMNSPDILRKYIKFPTTQEQREVVSRKFMDKFGFPGVLGCVDGTHMSIIRPSEFEEAYFNRKQYHSLNAMMICDADLQIIHVDASFGGASHDSHIWNSSPVRALMEGLHEEGEAFWLLGDSGYAQRPWMMTPILNAAPNSAEEHYTRMQIKTRNVIERCFGVLKGRWRCLLAHRTMHYHPVKAGKMANACVVLHNLINDHTVRFDQETQEELARDRVRQPVLEPARLYGPPEDVLIPTRAAIVQRLWRSRQEN